MNDPQTIIGNTGIIIIAIIAFMIMMYDKRTDPNPEYHAKQTVKHAVIIAIGIIIFLVIRQNILIN